MPDTTPPTVLTFIPADEESFVAVGSYIGVTFSEAIQRGPGNIVLKTASGATIATYGQNSENVAISGNTLIINPTSDLGYNTGYKIEFSEGSIKDISGNNYAGTTSYNFTTIAERVTSGYQQSSGNIFGISFPNYGKFQQPSYVDSNGVFYKTAGEDSIVGYIRDGTVGALILPQGVRLGSGGSAGDRDTNSFIFDASNNTLRLKSKADINNPTDLFLYEVKASTPYLYSLEKDNVYAVNFYTETGGFNFSGVVIVVPNANNLPTGGVIVSGTVSQGQVLTASNSLADIDGLGIISYQWMADGLSISGATSNTFTLTQAQVGKSISVKASYTDLFGTEESVTSTATALVTNPSDTTTPTVVSFSPVDEATSVALDSNLVITFSENIQRGSGNIVLKTTGGSIVETYGQSSGNISIADNKVTINPTANLDYSSGYHLSFASDAIKDSAGNNYVPQDSYDFTTQVREQKLGDTDPNYGFVEIRNLKFSSNKSQVTFDLALDASVYNGQKIAGLFVDLNYDSARVQSDAVSSVNVTGTSDPAFTYITNNLSPNQSANGKINAVANFDYSSSTAGVTDANGKVLSVTLDLSPRLTLDKSRDSFNVGFDQAVLTLANGASVDITTGYRQFAIANSAPIANDLLVTTNEDALFTGALPVSDADLDALTYTKVADPSNGTVAFNSNGTYTYTPNANFNGTDAFTFKANDGLLDSAAATVSIAVKPVAKFWKDNTKTPSESDKAYSVNLTDAIAILKMIVGLNVNSNNTALSPYQAIAADFDQSGDVGLTDAIGVLKMVVGLSAPTPTWKYYDDAKLASTYTSAQSLNPKGWTTTAVISDTGTADSSVKLVGVLTGDVDGSWTGV